MKTIKVDLPESMDKLELHALADLHIGDPECDIGLIKRTIQYIQETPNARCTLGGDLLDTATASSVSDTYSAKMNPNEQLAFCAKLFEPIKEKILYIVPGNHESRIWKSDGVSVTEILADKLGLIDRYSPTTVLAYIRLGRSVEDGQHGRKVQYAIYQTHGSGGGGKKEGSKVNKMADYSSIVDADIYISSHVHLPAAFRDGYFRTSAANSTAKIVDKLFVSTAAALKYGGYGDTAGFKPASLINPIIYLDGNVKLARVLV